MNLDVQSTVSVVPVNVPKLIEVIRAACQIGLVTSGELLKDGVIQGISNPGTGRIYPSKTGRGTHQAAAPGDPISRDTGGTQDDLQLFLGAIAGGGLDGSAGLAGLEVAVGWEGKRALQMWAQEFGDTRGMPPHPVLTPVALSMEEELTAEMRRVLSTIQW